MPITVYAEIDRHAAIIAGIASQGGATITLTDEHLATLAPHERAYLAALPNEINSRRFNKVEVLRPTPEALLTEVRAKVARFNESAQSARKVDDAFRSPERKAEIEAIDAAERAASQARSAAEAAAREGWLQRLIARIAEIDGAGELLAAQAAVKDGEVVAAKIHPIVACEGDFEGRRLSWDDHRRTIPSCEPIFQRAAALAKESDAAARRQIEALAEHTRVVRAEWVAQHAEPAFQARFAAGYVSDEELDTLIRDWLFEGLEQPAFQRLGRRDLPSSDDCDHRGEVTYSADDSDELTQAQFDRLVEVRDQVLAKHPHASVRPQTHTVLCQEQRCKRDRASRESIFVELEWGGRPYSRRFAL